MLCSQSMDGVRMWLRVEYWIWQKGRKWQRHVYLDFTLSPGDRSSQPKHPNISDEHPAGNEKILGTDINLPVAAWYLTVSVPAPKLDECGLHGGNGCA